MATVGNIVAQFTADTGGLQKGVEDAISYFQSLRDQITGATEDIKQFNSVLAAQVAVANAALNKMDVEKSIRIDADVTDLKTAIDEADKLASLSFTADTSAVSSAIEGLSSDKPAEIAVKADTTSLSTATGVVKQFASTSGELFSRSGEEVVKGAERFDQFRSSATAMAGGVTKAYSEIKNASNQTANAVNAVGAAATAISEAGQSGFDGFSKATEATVVAAGRSYDAAVSLATAYRETIPAAATASVAGFRALVAQLGGVSTLTRAAGGSAAATAVTVGSLAGAFSSAITSIGVYAAVVTAAKVASSGMSEEAQGYVERGAQVAGAFAGATAGAMTATSAYRLVATALYGSSTATQFFQKMIQGLGQGIASAVATSASFVNRLTQIQTVLSLVSAASDKATTAVGFAALSARVAVTSVMFGALAGGVRAYAAGTAVATGVTSGASVAIAGLASTFPLAAVGAMAAAVATGKFFHALEHLSVATQSLDQMAERFGTTTQEMEKLKLAADNTQVSMRMLGRAQQSFYQNLSKIKSGQFNTESVREAKIAFDKLGISAEELKEKRPDEAFRLVAEELSKVEDAAKRTSIAMDLFGRTGGMILPALKELEEIEQDFKRLGGALNSLDTKRLLDVEASFDRLAFAGKSLSRTLLIPFVELQKAFNNFAAEVKGGVSTALAPLASMLADVSKPLAIIVEMVGRVIGIFLRMVAVIIQVAAASQAFAAFAAIFEGIKSGFDAAMKPLEDFIAGAAELASGFAAFMRPAAEFTGVFSLFAVAIRGIGAAVGVVLASLAQLAIYIAVGAAAWGIYTVAIGLASATSLIAAVNFAIAWAAALGPITIAVVALAAIGAAVTYLASALVAAGKWVYGLAKSFFGFSDAPETIDAARASVEELAEASRAASEFKGAKAPAFDEVKKSVTEAREEINGLIIESARYGSEGAAAAQAAQEGFSELQQKLSEGRITLEEFDEQTKKNTKNLEENLKSYKDDSPAIALKKNLELYKQLNDSVKAVEKSVRDIGAGMVVGDKFFPSSAEVKSRAAQFKNEYTKAIEEIKKKQQEGGFAAEITQKKEKNEADFTSGNISREQYEMVKLELDSTNAQEQASIAGEEAKREFDRNFKKIGEDVSFAENIRKELETAFLSPVQKFEKELKKIADNPELTDMEKTMASADLRKKATESLVGKDGQTTFQERTRDVKQAAAAGLIGEDKLKAELQKASEDFAAAVGVTKTPFEAFSSSLDNIAKQFGFAGQPLDVVREKLKGNSEQLAMFDRALKESRDNLLASLGIEKTPQQVFDEQIKKINEAVNATDPNKKITEEQADQAKSVATKKRDSSFGIENATSQTAERRKQIDEAFGGGQDPAKFAAAMSKAAEDFASSVGVTKTPFETFSSSLNNIAAKFGFAGQPLDVVREKLKGNAEQLALFDRALKESRDNLLASLGIEKSPQQVLDEQLKKIDEAANATDPNKRITATEAAQAKATATRKRDEALGAGADVAGQLKERQAKINESFGGGKDPAKLAVAQNKLDIDRRSAAGLDATPAQALQAGVDKINDAFGDAGKGTAEYNEAIKKNRDTVLQSIGVEKSAASVRKETEEKIASLGLTAGETAQAEAKKNDAFMSALGITKTPFEQFSSSLDNIAAQFDMAGKPISEVREKLKGNAKDLALLERAVKQARDAFLADLGIEKTPQQVFQEQMKKIEEAANSTDPEKRITKVQADQARTNAARKRDEALGGESASDFGGRIKEQRAKIEEAYGKGGANDPEKFKSAMRKLNESIPGAEQQSPVQKFQEDLEKLKSAFGEGTPEFEQGKKNLQAQLQEDLAPALDATKQDRRGIEGSDARSKGGVDTFFRILRGNDNPSLKAQLEVARNTKILAEASKNKDAAPVIAQLSAPR